MRFEIELNRGWVCNIFEEEIGETNFVIALDYLKELWLREDVRAKFNSHYGENDLSLFLDIYDPDTEGQIIYDIAKAEDKIIEDIGVTLYQ